MNHDGDILSFATILLGFWLLVFLLAGGFFVYLFVTKMDQEKTLREQDASKENQYPGDQVT